MRDINKRCLMRKEEENGNIMYHVPQPNKSPLNNRQGQTICDMTYIHAQTLVCKLWFFSNYDNFFITISKQMELKVKNFKHKFGFSYYDYHI